MSDQAPDRIIERLYGTFLTITASEPSHGRESADRQLLEDDVFLLGQYFGATDPIEGRTSTSLLAECIAYLRAKSSPLPVKSIIEEWIENVLRELNSQPLDPVRYPKLDSPKELVEVLKTIKQSRELRRRGLITRELENNLRQGFLDLANLFLLRDGNVTDKEMDAIRQFEQFLLAS